MTRDFSESDWKVFRKLREEALSRFSQRVLDELGKIAANANKTPHERYLIIYKLIHSRNKTFGDAFDNPRRSTAIMQLLIINSQGLITKEELQRFSLETQELVLRFSSDDA